MRQHPILAAFSCLLLEMAFSMPSVANSGTIVIDGNKIESPRMAYGQRKFNNIAAGEKTQEAARRKAQDAARRKAAQDAARRKAQDEARRKALQDSKRKSSAAKPLQKDQPIPPREFKAERMPWKPSIRPSEQKPNRPGAISADRFKPVRPNQDQDAAGFKANRAPKSKPSGLLGNPGTNTTAPSFLSELGTKNHLAPPNNNDEPEGICWWEPEPSPVVNINIHVGSGDHCWRPIHHHHWWFGGGWHWHHHASTCTSFGWGFLCWSRPPCHTVCWRPWWDRPNCVEWCSPTWTWCPAPVQYVTLPPPPPAANICWDALEQGDIAQARRDFLRRLAVDPHDADSRLGLGLCEGLRGNESGMRVELLRALEDEPRVCMTWRPRMTRDRIRAVLHDATEAAKRVDTPERWVAVGILAAVAQEDGFALAAMHQAFAHHRTVLGADLLHQLVLERKLELF